MKIKNKIAFTLVELIVVITILAILATIGFISFQGYAQSARDSVRLADMSSIQKGLNIKVTKAEKLPIPDNKIDITASGTILTYQGFAGKQTLGQININGEGKDPLSNNFYTLGVNVKRNKFQLLGFFENENFALIQNKTYADLSQRYPKVLGDEIGIILKNLSKEPVQTTQNNVDIVDAVNDYNILINNTKKGSFIGSGSSIINKWSDAIDAHSCEEILNNFSSEYLENKNYPILSNTGEEIEVFCDMKHGGFTGLFSVDPAGITWKYDSPEWVIPTVKENDFLSQETTLKSYTDFTTNSVKICRGDLEHCYIMNHNYNIPLVKFYRDNLSYIEFSKFQYLNNYSSDHSYNNNDAGPINIGNFDFNSYLNSLNLSHVGSYIGTSRYSKYGLGINIYARNRIGFQADNNNHWPGFDNFTVGVGGFPPYGNGTTSCIGGYPHSYDRATSIHISGQECYIDNPDTVMWYVLGK